MVKYSTNYQAQMSRIRRLPRKYDEVIRGAILRDAEGVIAEFRQGILRKNFRLVPLRPATIDRKRSAGAQHPDFPLYDAGPRELRSYMNMMQITRLKNGYKVGPNPRALHHSKRLRLADLFVIHEYGATIKQFKSGQLVLIRIPPRPAWELAYDRLMKKRKTREPRPAVEVRRAITQFVKTGKEDSSRRRRERYVEGMMRGLHEI